MTDLELLDRYRLWGDRVAFDRLVQRYYSLVLRVCRRQLRNEADADDAAQQVFWHLLSQAPQIHSNIAAWLHRCAHNVSVSLVRFEDGAAALRTGVSGMRSASARRRTRRRLAARAGRVPGEHAGSRPRADHPDAVAAGAAARAGRAARRFAAGRGQAARAIDGPAADCDLGAGPDHHGRGLDGGAGGRSDGRANHTGRGQCHAARRVEHRDRAGHDNQAEVGRFGRGGHRTFNDVGHARAPIPRRLRPRIAWSPRHGSSRRTTDWPRFPSLPKRIARLAIGTMPGSASQIPSPKRRAMQGGVRPACGRCGRRRRSPRAPPGRSAPATREGGIRDTGITRPQSFAPPAAPAIPSWPEREVSRCAPERRRAAAAGAGPGDAGGRSRAGIRYDCRTNGHGKRRAPFAEAQRTHGRHAVDEAESLVRGVGWRGVGRRRIGRRHSGRRFSRSAAGFDQYGGRSVDRKQYEHRETHCLKHTAGETVRS